MGKIIDFLKISIKFKGSLKKKIRLKYLIENIRINQADR